MKSPYHSNNISIGAAIAAALSSLCSSLKRCVCACPFGSKATEEQPEGEAALLSENRVSLYHSSDAHIDRTRDCFTQTSPAKTAYSINTTNNIAIFSGMHYSAADREELDALRAKVKYLEQRSEVHEEAIRGQTHLILTSRLKISETMPYVYRSKTTGELLPPSMRAEAARILSKDDLSQVSVIAHTLRDTQLLEHLHHTTEQYVSRLGDAADPYDSESAQE